jgi:hypothetical protein
MNRACRTICVMHCSELDDSEVMNKYIDPKYIDIFIACKESELEEFNTPSPTLSTTGICTRFEAVGVKNERRWLIRPTAFFYGRLRRFAGKPAPTVIASVRRFRIHQQNLWERACPRWRPGRQHQALLVQCPLPRRRLQ